MVFKGLVAATAAMALAATPVMAQTAAPLAVAPASETVEGSELRGGVIVPLIALVAVILGILVIIDDDDGPPDSP